MKVIEHKPLEWFLLQQGDDYYIDVNCSRSFVGFSVSVQLNSSEKMHYKNQGFSFIDSLGEAIAQKSEINHPRNIDNKELLDTIHEAIMEWNKNQT